jgi:DNA/RNA endonuclease G (NUC1)
MVRREDPNRGDPAEAQEANDDTFHYTNSAPQHARLNQNKRAWLGLEEYVLGSAKTHGLRATVFTGPVIRDEDPVLEDSDLQIPQEFWKAIVMVDADRRKLHATGYVLGQGELIRDITEGFVSANSVRIKFKLPTLLWRPSLISASSSMPIHYSLALAERKRPTGVWSRFRLTRPRRPILG